jgi:signal transduction histidine kinase
MKPTPTLSLQIRRRLAAALATAWLFIAVLIAALWLDAPQAVLIASGLLVTGAAAGSFFLVRPVSGYLKALDSIEQGLISAEKAGGFKTLDPAPPGATAIYAAYNSLARRSAESGAKMVKYLSQLYHEGNTLLASILGYGSMIADPSLRPDDANLEEYGQIIVDQARSTAGLLEDLTMAARIEGGLYAPTMRPVRLAPLLETLAGELAEQSGREIALSRSVENTAIRADAVRADAVRADALSLEKALRKILENALKFSSPESPVCVSLDRDELARHVLVRIQDQGTGIPVDEMTTLFQPFARGKQEAARRTPGYGLGLYIANAIVRAHQGEISVQTAPGQGAVFTVTLPLEETNG